MKSVIDNATQSERLAKIVAQMALDGALILASFVFAMYARLESTDFLEVSSNLIAAGGAVAATLLTFKLQGLYRVVMRFVTGEILLRIGMGALAGVLVLYVSGIFVEQYIPPFVPITFGILIVVLVGGLRFFIRGLLRGRSRLRKRPILIYGAGDAGLQLLSSLYHHRDYVPVAFIDDNADRQGLLVGGIFVYAPSEITKLIRASGAEVALLAIPSLGSSRRREIVGALSELHLEVKSMPDLNEILNGNAKLSELRDISVEDLLGRDQVEPDHELLGRNITGCVVMVSGAGGSIGSELCRQIISQDPNTLVLLDTSEFALYSIQSELDEFSSSNNLSVKLVSVLGSVQNRVLLESTVATYGVQTIYHAAAYKHVPLLEDNIVEGVRNNVFGTMIIASVAAELRVKNFTLISTDKAVRPTNLMGATKRIAELVCQAHALEAPATVFSMVRFGNVLGSSGSVIPRFSDQIKKGGPLTLTHMEITRYFMSIPEAAQLVIQAGAMGSGGEVFVLDMGEPVKILDLAQSMARLHGLNPCLMDSSNQASSAEGDIAIRITGLRKGEKLYEELLIGNNATSTLHPRIMMASEASMPMKDLVPMLEQLGVACDSGDLSSIVKILVKLPLGYQPPA